MTTSCTTCHHLDRSTTVPFCGRLRLMTDKDLGRDAAAIDLDAGKRSRAWLAIRNPDQWTCPMWESAADRSTCAVPKCGVNLATRSMGMHLVLAHGLPSSWTPES